MILLLRKDDPFVKFHSVQALALFAAEFVFSIILGIAAFVLVFATFGIGMLIIFPLVLLIALALLALEIFLMYKAYKGEKYKLPVIGDWAENFR